MNYCNTFEEKEGAMESTWSTQGESIKMEINLDCPLIFILAYEDHHRIGPCYYTFMLLIYITACDDLYICLNCL